MRANIVGSGAGSIASAIRLRSLGFEVNLYEVCPDLGGRARTFTFKGQSFDAGPTVITAPWLFDELFEILGEKRKDHIEFLPCDPWYRLLFENNSSLDLVDNVDCQIKEIAKISLSDSERYSDFMKHGEALYKIGYEELGAADFTKFSLMFRVLPTLLKLGGFRTLWGHTGRYFKDDRIRQAFSLQTLLVGGNPLTTTSIYGLIHAMERRGGIWFTKGGTGALISELVALAKRHGVLFHCNSFVSNLKTDSEGRVTALGINNNYSTRNEINYEKNCEKNIEQNLKLNSGISWSPCDVAVWGADPQLAYKILGASRTSWVERLRAKTVKSSMGLFVLYFKTKKTYPAVAHHTIILSKRWHGLLYDVFEGKKLPKDPSLYLHRPTATDKSLEAETEGDIFYVLAPVPHLGNFNEWENEISIFKTEVLKILEERVLPELIANLEFAEAVDPRYFHNSLHSTLGAGFSIAPTLTQSAWFRFHNRSDLVSNLYFCGAGVHPGGGVPGVVTSAKIIEQFVKKDFNRNLKNFPQKQRISEISA